jgi:serine/threonine protein kinase
MERRGTFVGTVNYLAPEMIEKNSASMATDIWSLGCIIFKLITGNVPFTGIDPNLVFQKILIKDIDFPEYLSVDAVSFIDSLLMITPLERLGSPGSPCGIENLKKHPFLKGIDFSSPVGPRLSDHHRSLILGGDSTTTTLDTSNLKNIPRRSAFMPSELAFSNVILRGYLLKKNRWFNK